LNGTDAKCEAKKLHFVLDDVFYEALAKSDIIALRVKTPNTLLDTDMSHGFNFGESFLTKDFYSQSFELSHPEKDEIAAYSVLN